MKVCKYRLYSILYRKIEASSQKVMPWKNGGGITTEIAKDGTEPFLWRASRAQVASDGPFSFFPGYDRILIILQGKGMVLKFPDKEETLGSQLTDRDLFHFKGEDEIHTSLIDGPVTDWNWITRRESGSGKVSILRHPSD